MIVATTNGKKDISLKNIISSYPTWAHPSVHYHSVDWEMLRDTFQGERQVKEKGHAYLPQPSGLDDSEYDLYLENATFYNMTNRTVGALVGTIFRRNPVISNLPKKLQKKVRKITKNNQSLRSFTRRCAKEVVHMGRYGVLVDMPAGGGDPYLTGYVTEAILDWSYQMVGDREVLTEVLLMEAFLPDHASGSTSGQRSYKIRIRALRLVDGRYEQHVYDSTSTQVYPDVNRVPDQVIVPTNRGTPLRYIPFIIFGTESNSPDVERSSMLDIAQMNISHFRSYAHLEHGRFYTGLPVYYVSKGTGEGKGEYTIGASVVWEIGAGENAGIIEFNGNGLKFLENAIATKEAHISTLGGRLIGVTTSSVSESDNQVSMKDRNEQALLLNVSMALDEGFTQVLQWWASWQDVQIPEAEEISIEFNKDFMLKEAAAREFRAVQQMYQDGILPIEVVYDYLKKAEVIPDWLELEEFKKLLASKNSFPNNPDAEANSRGFPDRKTELELEEAEKDRKSQEQIAESQAALALKQARTPKPAGAGAA
ncbi:DUF4055 domain-containing protein [Sinorhizobium meliloti]|nr:DUF4055 domain-containing protein [Sinorhizobium meliloti]